MQIDGSVYVTFTPFQKASAKGNSGGIYSQYIYYALPLRERHKCHIHTTTYLLDLLSSAITPAKTTESETAL